MPCTTPRSPRRSAVGVVSKRVTTSPCHIRTHQRDRWARPLGTPATALVPKVSSRSASASPPASTPRTEGAACGTLNEVVARRAHREIDGCTATSISGQRAESGSAPHHTTRTTIRHVGLAARRRPTSDHRPPSPRRRPKRASPARWRAERRDGAAALSRSRSIAAPIGAAFCTSDRARVPTSESTLRPSGPSPTTCLALYGAAVDTVTSSPLTAAAEGACTSVGRVRRQRLPTRCATLRPTCSRAVRAGTVSARSGLTATRAPRRADCRHLRCDSCPARRSRCTGG